MELSQAMYFLAGGFWKRVILVADFEELEEMDASEIDAKGLTSGELILPEKR